MQEKDHDLTISRRLDAPRAAVWRCWTEPELLMQWFCPAPWRVSAARMDPRAGGAFDTTMNGPEGEEFANQGIFVEVVPMERLVTTNQMTEGFRPVTLSQGSFAMTAIITLADHPEGGTHYTAIARHASQADSDTHAAMGFDPGWNAAADQLEALARSL